VTIATIRAAAAPTFHLVGNADLRIKADLASHHSTIVSHAPHQDREIRAESPPQVRLRWRPAVSIMIGTERHESRRTPPSCRPFRAARRSRASNSSCRFRTTDAPSSAPNRMDSISPGCGWSREAITSGSDVQQTTRCLKARRRSKARNFEIPRPSKYDDVLNDQRKVIFEQRREIHVLDYVLRPVARVSEGSGGGLGPRVHIRKRPMPNSGTQARPAWRCKTIFLIDCRWWTGPEECNCRRRDCSSRIRRRGKRAPRPAPWNMAFEVMR